MMNKTTQVIGVSTIGALAALSIALGTIVYRDATWRADVVSQLQSLQSALASSPTKGQIDELNSRLAEHDKLHRSLKISQTDLDEMVADIVRGVRRGQ